MEQRATHGQPLVIRADADSRVGIGHVMRCLALAQVWRQTYGSVTFIGRLKSAPLRARLAREGFNLRPMATALSRHRDTQVISDLLPPEAARHAWCVVDGYNFDAAYHRALRKVGFKVLVMDDNAHLSGYEADIILNQNLHADTLHYPCNPDAVLLLGTTYTLLRQEFRQAVQAARRPQQPCRRLLVTLGGADPKNVSLTVLKALQRVHEPWLADLQVRLLVGPANPHLVTLQRELAHLPFDCKLVSPGDDISALMNWADVAISAAGSTCWELAYMGIPFGTIVVADNQQAIAERLADTGVAVHFGRAQQLSDKKLAVDIARLMADSGQRRRMAENGRRLVDGHGAARVVAAMTRAELTLRLATEVDKQLLFHWVNDPLVRRNSFRSNAISWAEHCTWFDTNLHHPACLMLIAMLDGERPVGLVRFDMQPHNAIVSVSLSAAFRGQGLGSRLIYKACETLFATRPVNWVDAYIKTDNVASQHAFAKAGFCRQPDVAYQGESAVMMRLTRARLSSVCEAEKGYQHA